MNYLSSKTVKELVEIAKQMGLTYSGLKKAELVAKLVERIDGWHVIALDMNKAIDDENVVKEDEYMVGDVLFTGAPATILKAHDKRLKRYNPTLKRDKEGCVILTPKQRRRIHKKLRAHSKKVGMFV